MPVPDARTRSKISLNPAKVLSSSCVGFPTNDTELIAFRRIPSKHIPRIFLSNLLFVFAAYAAKEWLLQFDVGVFWVLMRVLACGGFGVVVWELVTKQLAKGPKNIEVRLFVYATRLSEAQSSFTSGPQSA